MNNPLESVTEQLDATEKKDFNSSQPNNVHLLKLVSYRNFARDSYLQFEKEVAEPAKHLTLQLQEESLKLGKRIAERKRQIHGNASNENASADQWEFQEKLNEKIILVEALKKKNCSLKIIELHEDFLLYQSILFSLKQNLFRKNF